MTVDAADKQERDSSQVIDYAKRLEEIKDKISDKNLSEQEKTELNGKLDEAFRKGLLGYMESTDDQKTLIDFKKSLSDFLNGYSDENKENDEAYKSLMALADIMGLEKSADGKWSEKKKDSVDVQADSPKFELVGNLSSVELRDMKDREQNFRNGVVKEKPGDGEEPSEDLRLYEVIKNGHDIGDRIKILLEKNNLSENDKQKLENIQKLSDDIENKILADTSPDNVRALQKFIYDNVYASLGNDANEKLLYNKKLFESKNKENGKFDGKFGRYTLMGLKDLCDKIGDYVKDLEEKVKGSGESPSDPGSSVDTDGPLNGGQTDTQPDAAPSQPQVPLTLSDGSHQVISTSQTIAQNAGLSGAVFYTAEVSDETDGQATVEVPLSRECLMKFGDKTYKVKLDSNNNLCPIMEDINDPENKKILLENNQSCINYLTGKLPDNLKSGGVKIMWFDGDYVIGKDGYSKWLTIEPMTIDGKWLSEGGDPTTLEHSLAFLNFTNYLRNEGQIQGVEFRNNHPDLRIHDNELYVRVNKNSNKKLSKKNGEEKGELGWKWQKVNIDSFGLPALDSKAFQNFIKYNNGEDWNDNWDKKEDNKGYKKISLSGEAIVAPVVQGNPGDGASLESAGQQRRGTGGDALEDGAGRDSESLNQNGSMSLLVVKNPILEADNFVTLQRRDVQIVGVGGFSAGDDEGFAFFDNVKNSETGVVNYNDGEYNEVKYKDNGEPESSVFVGKGYESGSIDLDGDKKLKFFFIGEYENGLKNGNGIMVFENGATYEGNFKDGKIDGDGTYRYPNGDIYKGAFSDGKITSDNAEYTWNDSLVQYEGGFNDGKITKGQISFKEGGSEITYEVEMDEKGLKIISEGDNNGKYFDVKTGEVIQESGVQ